MQLVVKWGDRGNFLVDVPPAASVDLLKHVICQLKAVECTIKAASIEIVCDGVVLANGGTLEEFGVKTLDTLTMNCTEVGPPAPAAPSSGEEGKEEAGEAPTATDTGASAADLPSVPTDGSLAGVMGTAAPTGAGSGTGSSVAAMEPAAPSGTLPRGAAHGAPAAPPEHSQMVTSAEIRRAIVVTNIPPAAPDKTETALFDAFSEFGAVARIIFQMDEAGDQHAVLIFTTIMAARNATAYDTLPLLGKPVSVVLAERLPTVHADRGSAPGGRKEDDDAGAGKAANGAVASDETPPVDARIEAVADLLAKGFMFGNRGMAQVRRFDDAHGISMRVKVAAEMAKLKAEELDERHNITQRVTDLAVDVDERLSITKLTTAGVERMQQLLARAMKNERVKSSVTTLGDWMQAASDSAVAAYQLALAQAAAAEEESDERPHVGTEVAGAGTDAGVSSTAGAHAELPPASADDTTSSSASAHEPPALAHEETHEEADK